MSYCVNHPHKKSTYDVPKHFCDDCWARYWSEGSAEMYQDVLWVQRRYVKFAIVFVARKLGLLKAI